MPLKCSVSVSYKYLIKTSTESETLVLAKIQPSALKGKWNENTISNTKIKQKHISSQQLLQWLLHHHYKTQK